MSGLTLSATRALFPSVPEISSIFSSSRCDSALKARIPTSTPRRISFSVLPTPEKTIRSGGTPHSSAARSSPPETTSSPGPERREGLEHRQVSVGLHGVADQVRHGREGGVESPEVLLDEGAAVEVDGRPDFARDFGERDPIAGEFAVLSCDAGHGS